MHGDSTTCTEMVLSGAAIGMKSTQKATRLTPKGRRLALTTFSAAVVSLFSQICAGLDLEVQLNT